MRVTAPPRHMSGPWRSTPGGTSRSCRGAYFAYFHDRRLRPRRDERRPRGHRGRDRTARLAASSAWIAANAWLALGDYDAARAWLTYAQEAGKDRLWTDQVEIRIRLAEGRDGDAHELLDEWVARIPPEGGAAITIGCWDSTRIPGALRPSWRACSATTITRPPITSKPIWPPPIRPAATAAAMGQPSLAPDQDRPPALGLPADRRPGPAGSGHRRRGGRRGSIAA